MQSSFTWPSPPQLLYWCVCCKRLWLNLQIPGKDLAKPDQIQTPMRAMVRNCKYVINACAHIFICKCIHVCSCSACRADQASCSCCLILQQVNRLKTYFNEALFKIERESLLTKQSLNNIEGEWSIHGLQKAAKSADDKSVWTNKTLLHSHTGCFTFLICLFLSPLYLQPVALPSLPVFTVMSNLGATAP